MMSEAEMRRLMESTGTEFDLAFVEMMAAHHQGAIDMANTELWTGRYLSHDSPSRSSTPNRTRSTSSSSGRRSGRPPISVTDVEEGATTPGVLLPATR